MIEVFERVTERLRQGRTIALASIVDASGSTPQGCGARMIVTRDGEIDFTIGGGGLEAAVIDDAKRAIESGRSIVKEYDFSGSGPGSVGMICGGRATVVIEVITPPEKLLIFGAGHVGLALAETAGGLGFALAVVDDRPEYLVQARFPDGVRLQLTTAGYDENIPEIDENTYAVIATRSHEIDLKALRYMLGRSVAYVGMMGSRKKAAEILGKLRAEGVAPETLRDVHAPVGVEIGSKTPKEIAISILAEIVRFRNARRPRG